MAQYQLTVDEDQVRGLFTRDDALAGLVTTVVQQILEAQVSDHLQAQPYERTEERRGYRNGYKPRSLTTRVGTLELRVPQVRQGEFSTDLFLRFQRSEQAFLLALMEMVLQGVSTRKVTKITEELCGTEISKSTVSALCGRLDPVVRGWNERPLGDTRYPFLVVDALVVKIREDERVRARSALIASGVNAAGYREILGLMLGDSESEASWGALFAGLKQRGLQGVDLVVSDHHGGLVEAVKTHFQGASWQRCQTHFTANILSAAPKDVQRELKSHLRGLLTAADPRAARALLQTVHTTFATRAPKALEILDAGFEDAIAVLALPEPYRVRLRTTNAQERLNEELRRRERVIRIFPNRASAVRLLGALLMEWDEQWATGKRYLTMDVYWQWKHQQQLKQQQEQAATQTPEKEVVPHVA
jgi:putative transposase